MFFYEEPLYRPPAEAGSLIIQITRGCPYNTCLFCGMYKGVSYRQKCITHIKNLVSAIPENLRISCRRIFLADGDSLHCGFDYLMEILILLKTAFPALARVSAYGSGKSLSIYSDAELCELKNKRLWMIYAGLESGSQRLWELTQKTGSVEELVSAMEKLKKAGIRISLTAILGLGGKKQSTEHALKTADAVNRIRPEYFSLLSLIGSGKGFLDHSELMTREELLHEQLMIIENICCRTIFRSNHSSNWISLEGTLPEDRNLICSNIRQIISNGYHGLKDVPVFSGESDY